MGLQKVALEIEKACEQENLKDAVNMIDKIKAEFEELKKILHSQKGELS